LYRPLLFVAWQALLAVLLLTLGRPAAWQSAAAWWPDSAALTGIVGLPLLVWLFARDGQHFASLFRFERRTWRGDLLVFIALAIVSGLVSFLPAQAAALWLFGDVQRGFNLLAGPLPTWVSQLNLIAFPVLVALTELPTYFGYVMPRLEALTRSGWLGVLVPVTVLAAQHSFLPLLPDGRFMLWRFLMFLPLALLIGLSLRWRPRLMPYWIVGHGLIDLLTALTLL
jgi:hypothetical protein